MSEVKRASVNEWYDTTLSSRLDRKTEDVIVITSDGAEILSDNLPRSPTELEGLVGGR